MYTLKENSYSNYRESIYETDLTLIESLQEYSEFLRVPELLLQYIIVRHTLKLVYTYTLQRLNVSRRFIIV